ncbi:MAG: hypothetical protein LBJ89_00725 [Holosporales bacterium]|jgi:hypothetical protein|nr:hypothetical protein [Holosporales bacterium]
MKNMFLVGILAALVSHANAAEELGAAVATEVSEVNKLIPRLNTGQGVWLVGDDETAKQLHKIASACSISRLEIDSGDSGNKWCPMLLAECLVNIVADLQEFDMPVFLGAQRWLCKKLLSKYIFGNEDFSCRKSEEVIKKVVAANLQFMPAGEIFDCAFDAEGNTDDPWQRYFFMSNEKAAWFKSVYASLESAGVDQ